jgi:pimeloyl-ACP methyl ester carboxylesterase
MAPALSLIPRSIHWPLLLTGSALFSIGVLAGGLWNKKRASTIPSPRTTLLPKLSKDEISDLPYPPDVLPGGRDVDTPYGSIRVYEFGPEDGRKVLLVHGISTPAIALGGVAHALVDHGCRVMLFDLFGRGYSDTPGDLAHDIRLFTTQILLVLASSPLSWTGRGSGNFSLIGYSLGGGIATTFASYFPDLIDTLILFAPAGILRPYHISKTSHIIYSEGIIPESLLQRLVRRRLRSPMAQPLRTTTPHLDDEEGIKTVDATEAVAAEVGKVNLESNSRAVLSKSRPHVTVEKTVLYQLDNYPGFVYAFMSSIRYGPVRYQHDRWRIFGEHLTRQNQANGTNKKVLIVLGRNDPIIIQKEVEEDASDVLGGNVEFVSFDAGHEVPVTKGEEVVKAIVEFWSRTD